MRYDKFEPYERLVSLKPSIFQYFDNNKRTHGKLYIYVSLWLDKNKSLLFQKFNNNNLSVNTNALLFFWKSSFE